MRVTLRGCRLGAAALATAVVVVLGAGGRSIVTPAPGQGPEPIGERLSRALERAAPGERLPVLIQVERRTAPDPLSPSRKLRAAEHAADLASLYSESLQGLRRAVPGALALDLADASVIWVGGALAVELEPDQVRALASEPGVRRVFYDGLIEVPLLGSSGERIPLVWAPGLVPAQNPDGGLPRGLEAIGAPTLWAAGATGAGTVIAIIDSGVDGDHPLLRRKWRGSDTSAGEGWFDPWGLTATPVDDDATGGIGHGSVVASVALGSLEPGDTLFGLAGDPLVVQDELEVVTGVAPGARFIAANAFESFGGASYTRLSVLLQSMQWALDPDGDPASVSDVPDVVNNSWGFQSSGCDDLFSRAIDALELAGIPVVFAAGNRSAGLDTVAAPAQRADLLLNAFAVGATQFQGGEVLVSPNSLGGPSPCGPGAVKPEVVAPGEVPLVRRRTDNAAEVRGRSGAFTSWAAPHASGALALLRGLNSSASANDLKNALFSTAVDLPPAGLDNESGAGLINLPAAAERLGGLGGVRLALNGWDWRPQEAAIDIRLYNSGMDGFPGGGAELLRPGGGAPVSRAAAPAIAPRAAGVVSFSGLAGDLEAGERLWLRLESPDALLAFTLRLSAASVAAVTLADGAVQLALDANGRFGRVAGPVGFGLAGEDWLTGGGFLFARGEAVSDAVYTDVLQQPSLKANPVGSDTDWRALEASAMGRTAELRYADDRALRPTGATISEDAELVSLGDSAAYAIVSVTPSFPADGRTTIAALLLDWDFPSGDSVLWDAALGASVMTARGGAGPWMALTTHPRPPGTHAAVPLGTPDGSFYASGDDAGVLARADGFTDPEKSRFIRLGGRQTSTPGIGDWSQLISSGPLGADERVGFIVAAGTTRSSLGAALDAARSAAARGGAAGGPLAGGALQLLPAYPNPFEPGGGGFVSIPYLVARVDRVVQARLRVYTISGRLVFEDRRELGPSSPLEPFRWDGLLKSGEPAASGVYGYVLEVGGEKRVGKLLLLK